MNKFAVSVDLPQGNLGSRSILLASNIEKFKQRRKLVFHECYSLSLKTDKETTERKTNYSDNIDLSFLKVFLAYLADTDREK